MSLPRPPLLVITDRRAAPRPLAAVVAEALDAGCRWVMVREKDLAADALAALTAELVALAAPAGARILVNGDHDAAQRAGAAGVHLPQGRSLAAARAALGPSALIGVSAHSRAEAEAAAQGGADYVTLSPVYATDSKPGYGPALGPRGLRSARVPGLPALALGGVTPQRVGACIDAGAAGVAVMGGVMRTARPGSAVAEYLRALEAASAPAVK